MYVTFPLLRAHCSIHYETFMHIFRILLPSKAFPYMFQKGQNVVSVSLSTVSFLLCWTQHQAPHMRGAQKDQATPVQAVPVLAQ